MIYIGVAVCGGILAAFGICGVCGWLASANEDFRYLNTTVMKLETRMSDLERKASVRLNSNWQERP